MLDWTASRILVFAVVALSMVVYAGIAGVLLRRRGRGDGVWSLICQGMLCSAVRSMGWLALVFHPVLGPRFYDHVPGAGWVILISQTYESAVVWLLAKRVLRNGG